MTKAPPPPRDDLARELARELRGRAYAAPRHVAAASTDFGRLVERRPALVVAPADEDDVALTLRFASRHGLRVAVRGSGHSPNGQALCADGLVLAMRNLVAPPSRVAPDGQATVAAGATWGRVERALHPVGRTIPVLADYLGLSVGGTLSAGGYGADSILHGAQVDHVARLRLVTPDGEARWCAIDAPGDEGELCRLSLAGQGRLGVVTAAELRTIEHRGAAAFFGVRYRGLTELVASLAWMARGAGPWPDLFKAHISAHRTVAIYGQRHSSFVSALGAPAPACLAAVADQGGALADPRRARRRVFPYARAARHLAVELWLAAHPTCRRLWCDFVVDYPGLVALAALVSALERDGAFAGRLATTFILAIRRPATAPALPFEACGPPTGREQLRFGIGLYAMVPRGADDDQRKVRSAMRRCLEACIAAGGRPYLYGAHELGDGERQALYGPALDRCAELASRYDPGGVLGGEEILSG